MKRKKNKKFNIQFKHCELSAKLSDCEYMSCYSFNKRKNPIEFENLSSFFNYGYPFYEDKIQSIDFIVSGTTNRQYLITGIIGRIDKNNMYDRDIFNIFPEKNLDNTYSLIQSFDFKDENGKRLTDKYTNKTLTLNENKIDALYQTILTGSTTHFSIEDYSRKFEKFIKACYITYKKYL